MSTLYLPRLRPDQYAIAGHPAKRKYLAMGRRWGKTVLAGTCCASVLSQHGKVAWVVPTYKNSRPPWRWLQTTFADLAQRGIVDISKTEKAITSHRGGFLGIYSADNIDSIRGEWFHLVVNDECASLSEEAIYDAIDATLADADGDQLNIGTPKGRTWFWRDWQKAAGEMNAEHAGWTAPTSDNPSPNIRKAYDLAEKRLPARTFDQEWRAMFLDDAGGVFRGVRAAATLQPAAPYAGQFVFGVDWGKSNDFTAISVIDVQRRQQVALERFNQIDYAVQSQRLVTLYEAWRPTTILAEANSIGGPIIEGLQRLGLPVQPFTTSNASKATIIEDYALGIERGLMALLDNAVQTNELESYEMSRTSTGLPKYGAPNGMHDDTVIAGALSYHAAYGYGEFGI